MLNFKGWKMQSSDGQKATLKHDSGHEMTIAMKALPRIQREQIMRLAKVEHYAGGGIAQDTQSDSSDQSDNVQPMQPPTPLQQPASPVTIHITNGTPSQPQNLDPQQSPAGQASLPQVGNVQIPKVDLPHPNMNVLNPSGQPNPAAVQQAGQNYATGLGNLNAARAQAIAPLQQQNMTGQAQAQDNFMKVFNALQSETDAIRNDTNNGKIDAQAFWNKPGLFGETGNSKKLLSGIGLILGGAGAGMLGSTDNTALRFLNQNIDREIDAQQKSFNNKNTILGAYQHLFGAGEIATNMAKNALAEQLKNGIDLVDSRLGTPASKLMALKMKADLAQDQQLRNKKSAVNVLALPGGHPSYQDTGAENNPRPALPPGQQGPSVAQSPAGGGMTTADLNALHSQQSEPQAGSINHVGENDEKGLQEDLAQPITPILKPGAKNVLDNQLFSGPVGEKNYGDAKTQYDNAVQADKQLAILHGVYGDMINQSNEAGLVGRLHRTINPHALAGLGALAGGAAGLLGGPFALGTVAGGASAGGAAGEALGQGMGALTNTSTNRAYESNKTALFHAIAAALAGTNVSSGAIEDVVNKSVPEYGDSAKTLRLKLKNIEQLIKGNVKTGFIGDLINEQK